MRIVHLIDYYQPWMGYQETFLCQEQERTGHDVWVITSDRYMPKTEKLIDNRYLQPGLTIENHIKVLRLPIFVEFRTNNGYVFLKGLDETIGNIKPDVIHCHGLLSLTSLFAAQLKKKYHYKLIYDNHTSLLNLYNFGESFLKRIVKTVSYRAFAYLIRLLVCPRANSIVAIGEEEKDFLVWLFGSFAQKYPIIHLGADRRAFTPNPQARNDCRNQNKWTDNQIVLGHAGKIHPSKGIETLLQSIPLMPQRIDQLAIWLIGSIDPDYKHRLIDLAESLNFPSLLFFHPFASRSELPRLLNAIDIAVWPGDISNTVIEAMATSIPVVTCRTAYTQAIIEKYSAGILVKRGDPKDLANALYELIQAQDKRRMYGQNAKIAVESELNWECIAQQFINLYQNS